ncbi:MAG TPA: hypothetical protein VNN80_20495 [Polyangiaceae bacterium]|nr:hypothetical protein [Polyangiaceae bacterium]
MPVLSAPLLGFALGAGLYWSAARELARPIRPVAGSSLLVATILGLFVYAPAIALLLEAEPDWAYAYLVPAEALPRWLAPWLILMAAVSVPLGFGAALRVCRGRVSFVKSWFWVPAAAGLVPLAVASPRLAVQASFEQFHGDFGAHQLIGGPLGYLLLWSLLGIGIATWLARRCLGFLALGGAHGS